MIQFTATQLAKILKATIEGDPEAKVWKPCKIEDGEEGGITFLANMKYAHYFYEKPASIVIVDKKFVPEHPVSSTLLRVDNPYMAVARLLHVFNQMNKPKKGISCRSSIGRKSKLGKGCYVGEFAVIGRNVKIGNNVLIYPQVYVGDNVTIGDNTILYAGVKLYSETVVGMNCILHSGVVVGADGFGFAPTPAGGYTKIDQIGNVVIEDDVEIGANTCIDRATMGSTIVRKGVKLDNLCQVAHNVQVGENTVMCSQSGIAGSAKVGRHCTITGQVGIVGHIEVGDNVVVAAQSGVTNNIPSDSKVLGSPAIDALKQKRNYAVMRNLDTLWRRISDLEKAIKKEE